jgi:hypothetical protein
MRKSFWGLERLRLSTQKCILILTHKNKGLKIFNLTNTPRTSGTEKIMENLLSTGTPSSSKSVVDDQQNHGQALGNNWANIGGSLPIKNPQAFCGGEIRLSKVCESRNFISFHIV